VGVSRDCPNFFSTPIISLTVKLRSLNLADIFTGSMRTKAPYEFGRKAALACPGTSQFLSTPYYLIGSMRTKYPLKIGEKGSVGLSRDCQFFLEYTLLSQPQEQLKLRTSNFVRTFLVSIGTNAHYEFREK